MTDTKGTTRAPGGATPLLERAARPARQKVLHVYWVAEGEVAYSLGVEMKRLCGVWGPPPSKRQVTAPNVIQIVRGVPVRQPRNCKNCLRVLESAARRARRAKIRRLINELRDEL